MLTWTNDSGVRTAEGTAGTFIVSKAHGRFALSLNAACVLKRASLSACLALAEKTEDFQAQLPDYFPGIGNVCADLKGEQESADWEDFNAVDYGPDDSPSDDTSIDVRLQVFPSGEWSLHTGDACYDQDHRGFWGASSLSADSDCLDLARDLLNDAAEHAAQSGPDNDDNDNSADDDKPTPTAPEAPAPLPTDPDGRPLYGLDAPHVSFDIFAAHYCARQESTPGELRRTLEGQLERFQCDGWILLECHMMDSSLCGNMVILSFGPNNTHKTIPAGPVSPRGLASDMSVTVAVLTADRLHGEPTPVAPAFPCRQCGNDIGFDAPSGVCSETCLRAAQGFPPVAPAPRGWDSTATPADDDTPPDVCPDPEPTFTDTFAGFEKIRSWSDPYGEGFALELFDTNRPDGRRPGRTFLAYQFFHNGELLFQGDGFGVSPMHCDDSDETVAALLAFLSLKPGDTDPEYFQDYTPRQLAWCQEHGETLQLVQMEMEEATAAARN